MSPRPHPAPPVPPAAPMPPAFSALERAFFDEGLAFEQGAPLPWAPPRRVGALAGPGPGRPILWFTGVALLAMLAVGGVLAAADHGSAPAAVIGATAAAPARR